MSLTVLPRNTIKSWIEWRWSEHDCRVVSIKEGAYGLVWIAELPLSIPPRFALKGFNPDKEAKAPHADVRQLFERELGKWLPLGYHRNVLTAIGLEFVPQGGEMRLVTGDEQGYPLVRMPFAERTLSDWIGKSHPSIEERLVAIAQLCNGLIWAYDCGVSGHGDLKPENVLLRMFHGQEIGAKAPVSTWIVKVADFGWADIWEDFQGPEFARKAYRPYLAPERLKGEFWATASDTFAVGVIAIELLTGCHPADGPASTVARWTDHKYLRWAREGPRPTLGNVPTDINALLNSCLAPRPEDRPIPREILDRLCRAVGGRLDYDVFATLEAWNEEARQSKSVAQHCWELEELGLLGGPSLERGIRELEQAFMASPSPRSPGAVARWCSLTRLLLRRGLPQDRERAGDIALAMLRFVTTHFDDEDVDLRDELYRILRIGKQAVSDLDPAEVMLGFGEYAKRVLTETGRIDEAEASELQRKLGELLKRRQQTREEMIKKTVKKILFGGIERTEGPNGEKEAS